MMVLVVPVVMTLMAVLVHLIPGNPVQAILGPRADPALEQVVRRDMQLNESVPHQVWDFVTGAFQGKLGVDFISNESVTTLVFDALPNTVILAVVSLLLAVLAGVPLGVYAATRPNSIIDRVTGIIAVSCITIPPYVGGLGAGMRRAQRAGETGITRPSPRRSPQDHPVGVATAGAAPGSIETWPESPTPAAR
jgi:peptide/nickel transport system permease protein